MLLRSPAPLRSLRDLPFIGKLIHRLSHRIVPDDQKVWARVETGPARGLWLELNPRNPVRTTFMVKSETTVQKILAERLPSRKWSFTISARILDSSRCWRRAWSAQAEEFLASNPILKMQRASAATSSTIHSRRLPSLELWACGRPTGTLEFTTAGQASPRPRRRYFSLVWRGRRQHSHSRRLTRRFRAQRATARRHQMRRRRRRGPRPSWCRTAPRFVSPLDSCGDALRFERSGVARAPFEFRLHFVETIDSNHILALPG